MNTEHVTPESILEQFRRTVEDGDANAVLDAVSTAATLHLPMPPWLSTVVTGAIADYKNHDTKTLDEAFGLQRPKGQRQDAVQSELRNALYVIAEVLRLHANGQPVDGQIFEEAGATCGVKKTTAETWFYKNKNARTNIYLVAMQMAGVTDD